ncbi:unknown [Salmonella phage FelixO1]|uniref:Uncharacterized protein n=1 Tax=Salmonella phage Felix O1 (isolate Felix O1-VT1) TaxID=1283336 RepID=Q6KGE8_BPFO1|nr:unknown [Salmonella phage FelixO1]
MTINNHMNFTLQVCTPTMWTSDRCSIRLIAVFNFHLLNLKNWLKNQYKVYTVIFFIQNTIKVLRNEVEEAHNKTVRSDPDSPSHVLYS